MDKADFTFIVASFGYLVLALLCRSGHLYMAVLDIAGIVLWGILIITTLIKARFYMEYVSRPMAMATSAITVVLFILSTIIPIFLSIIFKHISS